VDAQVADLLRVVGQLGQHQHAGGKEEEDDGGHQPVDRDLGGAVTKVLHDGAPEEWGERILGAFADGIAATW
jgi:hypothetical protein